MKQIITCQCIFLQAVLGCWLFFSSQPEMKAAITDLFEWKYWCLCEVNPFFVYVTSGFQLLYQITTSPHCRPAETSALFLSSSCSRINAMGTWCRRSWSSRNTFWGFLSLKMANSVVFICMENSHRGGRGKDGDEILSFVWCFHYGKTSPVCGGQHTMVAPSSWPMHTGPGFCKHFDSACREHTFAAGGPSWHDHPKLETSFCFCVFAMEENTLLFIATMPAGYWRGEPISIWKLQQALLICAAHLVDTHNLSTQATWKNLQN